MLDDGLGARRELRRDRRHSVPGGAIAQRRGAPLLQAVSPGRLPALRPGSDAGDCGGAPSGNAWTSARKARSVGREAGFAPRLPGRLDGDSRQARCSPGPESSSSPGREGRDAGRNSSSGAPTAASATPRRRSAPRAGRSGNAPDGAVQGLRRPAPPHHCRHARRRQVISGEPFDRSASRGRSAETRASTAPTAASTSPATCCAAVPFGTHDTHGWPTFAGWPVHDTYTHQQTYYVLAEARVEGRGAARGRPDGRGRAALPRSSRAGRTPATRPRRSRLRSGG